MTNAISKNLLDAILPTYGNERMKVAVWNNSQKMFICDEYVSAKGNRHYAGVRFCNRLVVVERIGLYHSCTYINGLELYTFDGHQPVLIQKKDYDKVFRDDEMIRRDTTTMIADYVAGVAKTQRVAMTADDIARHAEELTEMCYKNFLDADYDTRLTQILPAIEDKRR